MSEGKKSGEITPSELAGYLHDAEAEGRVVRLKTPGPNQSHAEAFYEAQAAYPDDEIIIAGEDVYIINLGEKLKELEWSAEDWFDAVAHYEKDHSDIPRDMLLPVLEYTLHQVDNFTRHAALRYPKSERGIEQLIAADQPEIGDFGENSLTRAEESALLKYAQLALGDIIEVVQPELSAPGVQDDPGQDDPCQLDMHPVYTLGAMKKYIDTLKPVLSDNAGNKTKRIAEQAMDRGGMRRRTPCPELSIIYGLRQRFPNFGQLWDVVERNIHLQFYAPANKRHLHIEPLLLVGEPGIGKTRAVSALADAVGGHYTEVSMSASSAGFILAGLDAGWSTAKTGRVFDTLVYGDYADPIILLDEIDKAAGDIRYDVHGPLYALLEPHSAKRFKDECLPVELDTSLVSWIATANDLNTIPEPILSRMTVIQIDKPDRIQGEQIARSIYSDILASAEWGVGFEPALATETAEMLSTLIPREMRQMLLCGLGNAAKNQRKNILIEDIELIQKKENRLGFI